MANESPIFTGTAQSPGLEIENGDGTTAQTLVTAGASGSLIQSIIVTSTDTSGVDLQLFVNDGVADHLIGTVNIPPPQGPFRWAGAWPRIVFLPGSLRSTTTERPGER